MAFVKLVSAGFQRCALADVTTRLFAQMLCSHGSSPIRSQIKNSNFLVCKYITCPSSRRSLRNLVTATMQLSSSDVSTRCELPITPLCSSAVDAFPSTWRALQDKNALVRSAACNRVSPIRFDNALLVRQLELYAEMTKFGQEDVSKLVRVPFEAKQRFVRAFPFLKIYDVSWWRTQ